MEININDIKVKNRYRKDFGDLNPLKKSISEIGLMHPIVINEQNELIAGERRLKAVKELGWKKTPITKINLKEIIRGEFDENNVRKEFTITEKVAIWKAMENYQKDPFHWKSRGLSESDRGHTRRERASKVLGISTDSLSKAKQIIEKGTPEQIEKIDKGKSVNAIYKNIKLNEQKEEIEKNISKIKLKGKYDIIVIDPPWKYNDSGNADRAHTEYPTMSLEELKNIKLPAKDDCVLWIWTTNSFMKEAYELLNFWGFKDKTILTWFKGNSGMGNYLRNVTEHCILAVKGKPFFNNHNKYTTLLTENKTEHSTKPEIFYKIVEEICAGRKLDYFARKKRDGWDVYGDEIREVRE